MKQAITWSALILFVTWLLPLGAFIKPSQEQAACGGQRAICLCHAPMAMTHAVNTTAKPLLSHTDGSNKETNPSSGAGNYFLGHVLHTTPLVMTAFHGQGASHLYALTICSPIEHIPKF